MKTTGIILMAGNSTRYNKNTNKNLELLNNQYIFLYSLKVFNNNKNIDDIILVIRECDKEIILNILNKLNLNKKIYLVIGGSSRMESVYNAITSTNSDIVVIHDAARPFIKNEYIDDGIKNMDNYYGSVTCVPVKDTIKIINDNNEIISSTNRIYTYIGQTPQIFNRNKLLELHLKYKNSLDITDDSMLFEKEGYKLKIINGDYENIKITTPEDIIIAKEFINKCKIN